MEESIYTYVKSHIEDFDTMEKEALRIIEERGCSLSTAHWELYCKVSDAIKDYCKENGLNVEDYDTEDIFWDI